MSGKVKKILGVLILIAAVFLISFGLYNYFFTAKMKMMNVLFKNVETSLKQETTKIDKPVKISSDASMTVNNVRFNLAGDTYIDGEAMKLYTNLVAKIANEDFMSPQVYFENNELYFMIKEISSQLNFMKLEAITEEESEELTTEELQELMNIIKEQVDEFLGNDKFSKKAETITLSSKDYKTTKYTVSISYLDAYNILNGILKEIQASSKMPVFKKLLSDTSTSTLTKEEIIGSNKETDELINYSIYLNKGNEIIKQDLKVDTSEMTFAAYENDKGYMNIEMNLTADGTTVMRATVIGDKTSTIDIDVMAMIKITGTCSLTDELSTFNLNVTVPMASQSPIATLTYSEKEVTKDKQYEANLELKVNYEDVNLDAVFNNTISLNEAVPAFDKSNAVEYDPNDAANEFNINLNKFLALLNI